MSREAKRPSKLKKRLLTGGVLGALAALVIWLASLLPGLGLGLGKGGKGPGSESGKTTAERTPPEKPKPKKAVDRGRIVVVQIDAAGLRFRHQRDGKTTYEPTTIEEVVRRAKQVPGDERGFRVHIYFKGSGLKEDLDNLTKTLDEESIKHPPPFETFKSSK